MPTYTVRTVIPGVPVILLAGILSLLSGGSVAATDSGAVVLARVDGEPITTESLDDLLAVQKAAERGAPDAGRLSSETLLRRMIQNRLLEMEGYRNGADETLQIRNQVWDLSRHYGMIALLDSVTADVPLAEPEELGPALAQVNVIQRVSHILVDNEPLAAALVDSLESGADFKSLVERYSLDSATVKMGGDLGWARSDLYIPEFQEVLQGRSAGDVLGPVQAEDGWHVLLLAEVHAETIGQTAAMREEMREVLIQERVMASVREYVESVKEKYEYTLNEELLASLDYASQDPEVHAQLRRSEEVLASVTWRTFTVADLTREIRFEHYHGLQNKPNAAQIRDETYDEWVTQLILRHETAAQGFDRRPEIVAGAKRLERNLVREYVVNEIVSFRFEPTPEEIASYYEAHLEQFTPAPRMRAAGVILADEASARAFRDGLDQGAKVAWLATRSPGVVDADPAVFGDWISASVLGVTGSSAGTFFGPIEVNGIWTAGEILKVEQVAPNPLDQCRPKVMGAMKAERTSEAMVESVARLEAAAEIEILPNADEVIDSRLEQWVAQAAGVQVP